MAADLKASPYSTCGRGASASKEATADLRQAVSRVVREAPTARNFLASMLDGTPDRVLRANVINSLRFVCAVGLSLEYRQLCTERKDVQPRRMTHTNRFLFVGDKESQSILVYSLERNWAFVRAIGTEGSGAGQFRLFGMRVYRDRIVCDYLNDRLQFVDISTADAKDWTFDAPFGTKGTGKGQFNRPIDVCVAADVLFVVEEANNRVQTFTLTVSGATPALTLTHRSFIGGLDCPNSITCCPDASRVFVGDREPLYRSKKR